MSPISFHNIYIKLRDYNSNEYSMVISPCVTYFLKIGRKQTKFKTIKKTYNQLFSPPSFSFANYPYQKQVLNYNCNLHGRRGTCNM